MHAALPPRPLDKESTPGEPERIFMEMLLWDDALHTRRTECLGLMQIQVCFTLREYFLSDVLEWNVLARQAVLYWNHKISGLGSEMDFTLKIKHICKGVSRQECTQPWAWARRCLTLTASLPQFPPVRSLMRLAAKLANQRMKRFRQRVCTFSFHHIFMPLKVHLNGECLLSPWGSLLFSPCTSSTQWLQGREWGRGAVVQLRDHRLLVCALHLFPF